MSDHIEVPLDRMSPEALEGVIEEFITREGTDYGHSEATLETKKADVRRQLKRGEALIVFDPETETANIVLRRDLPGS